MSAEPIPMPKVATRRAELAELGRRRALMLNVLSVVLAVVGLAALSIACGLLAGWAWALLPVAVANLAAAALLAVWADKVTRP